jgi:hypothetical protein
MEGIVSALNLDSAVGSINKGNLQPLRREAGFNLGFGWRRRITDGENGNGASVEWPPDMSNLTAWSRQTLCGMIVLAHWGRIPAIFSEAMTRFGSPRSFQRTPVTLSTARHCGRYAST